MKLLPLLKQTMDVLDKHGIVYWSIGGTLLGQMRNKGCIPWDDDIDLGILDCRKTLNLPWDKYGMTCYRSKFSKNLVKVRNGSGCFIDLFQFTQGKDGAYTIDALSFHDRIEHMFPLIPRPFHHMRIPTPNGTDEYLDHKFGPDWKERLVVRWSHINKSCHKPFSLQQTPELESIINQLTERLTSDVMANEASARSEPVSDNYVIY